QMCIRDSRLPEPRCKAGGFLKQSCDCRHTDPPAATDHAGAHPRKQAAGTRNLAHIAEAVFAWQIPDLDSGPSLGLPRPQDKLSIGEALPKYLQQLPYPVLSIFEIRGSC
ncbi:hypothetical protein, partial [Rhizobium leguminosarum]|uniref:hypothetical protein n=1 Tax=Rhizobium leguminosarum TaxID=384 RepID=UPI001A8EB69B